MAGDGDAIGDGQVTGIGMPGHAASRRRRRIGCVLAAGLGGWIAGGNAARAQSIAPIGPDLRVGDLRGQFDSVFGNVPPPGSKAWQINYGLGVSETYDDGVFGRGRYVSDFITSITPSVTVQANSNRVQGNLYYAPQINIYAQHGNLNNVAQNLNGSATVTVAQDLFYIDANAYASQNPGYGSQTTLAPSYGGVGQVQTESFAISPRLEHRFGGTGTLSLADTISYTQNSAANNPVSNNATLSPYVTAVNGSSFSNQQHASFITGEDFGRLNSDFEFLARQAKGTGGAPSTSNSLTYSYTGTYALTRVFAVTGELGHENYSYTGLNGTNIDDVTWNAGVRVTPDPDTLVALSYGHQYGANSFNLQSNFAPTARIRVFASYGQSIGTQLDQLQNNLNNSRTSASGISIDPVTGAPILLNNNFATGAQLPVYRTTTAALSGVLTYDRDIFALTASRDDQHVLSTNSANTTLGTPVNTSGFQGSLAWTHTVSTDLFTNAVVQYTTRTAPFRPVGSTGKSPDQTVLTFNVSLNYSLSESLSATVQYYRTNTTGNIFLIGSAFSQPAHRDVATIGLQKTF